MVVLRSSLVRFVAFLVLALPAAAQYPSLSQCRRDTPDPSIAVGYYYIVHTANSRIKVTNASGTLIWWNNLDTPALTPCTLPPSGFFGATGPGATRIVDAKTLYDQYDPYDGRFVVAGLQINSATAPFSPPGIYIAYSNDQFPWESTCGGGGFKKYFTPGSFTVGGQPYEVDYSSLGLTPTHVVYSGILNPVASGPSGHLYRYFRKSDLKSGVTPLPYTDVIIQNRQTFEVPQSAHSFDAITSMYLVGAVDPSVTGPFLRVSAINQAGGPPLETLLTVPPYALAFNGAPQVGNPIRVDASDGRIINVVCRDQRLYTCHTIFTGVKNVARWYEIALNGWPQAGTTPSLVQSGDIDLGTNPAGNPIHTFFPAVARDAFGSLGFVFARSATDESPSIWRTGRNRCDPPGATPFRTLVYAGSGTFTNSAIKNGMYRWGDYFSIALDPLYPSKFWWEGEAVMPGAISGIGCVPTLVQNHWETRFGAWIQLPVSYLPTYGNFGAGWPGTGGVPQLTLDRLPIIGGTPLMMIDNSSGVPGAAATLFMGTAAVPPPGQATPFGGALWVDLSAAVTINFALSSPSLNLVPIPILCDPTIAGATFFAQVVEVDAGASHGISFTPGLSMTVGS